MEDEEENEAISLQEAALDQAEREIKQVEAQLLESIRSARSAEAIREIEIDAGGIQQSLARAIFNLHLLGRAQVWSEVAQASSLRAAGTAAPQFAALVLEEEFEPLPFDEAIDFFRAKTNVPPAIFATLADAARRKAFAIAAGATEQITASIRDLLDTALSDGLTLREFQAQAADVLTRGGVAAKNPWYWETVYRTNLSTSYQAGRWKQMTDPAVRASRPYLRYVSARTPTSRPSHVEKHGLVYPIDDPFWDEWMPPNSWNCLCSTMSVSEDLLERRGWSVSEEADFESPDFATNPGKTEEI